MEHNCDLLRAALATIAPLSDGEWRHIAGTVEPTHCEPGQRLQRAGAPSSHVFFLINGLVREYYTRADGRECTRAFVRSGGFTSAYADYLRKRPAQVTIEALQATRALALSLERLEDLRRSGPTFDLICQRLLEQMYIQKEKREFQFLTMTATERYACLTQDFPELETVVQQYLVASYLGITPVSLSRIRSRARRRGVAV